MNSEKATRIIMVLVVTFVFIKAFSTMVSYNFSPRALLDVGIYMAPVVLIVFLSASSIWMAFLLGGLTVLQAVPMPILNRLFASTIIALLICALSIPRSIIFGRGVKAPPSVAGRAMLLCALIILARFLYDKPGSIHRGDAGGAGEAFVFLVSFFAYYMTARLASTEWDVRRNIRVLAIILIFSAAVNLLSAFASKGLMPGIFYTFNSAVWYGCAVVVALALRYRLQRPGGLGATLPMWMAFSVTMGLSVFSAHRSSPVFGIGIIFAVAYIYGSLRRVALYVIPPALIVALGLLLVGSGRLPAAAARSLSTIVPMSQDHQLIVAREYGYSEETGWNSGFRAELYRQAWNRIKRHPVVGDGFQLSQRDLYYAYTYSWSIEEAAEKAAISGVYHNSLLELGVFCGLPAILLFIVAYVSQGRRFLLFAAREKDPDRKLMAASTMGFFVAHSGYMLMNGDAQSFFTTCVLLGFFRGMMLQPEMRTTEDEQAEAPVTGEEQPQPQDRAITGTETWA